MAKNNNTLLIVGALVIGAYFFLKPSTTAAAVLPASTAPDPGQLSYLQQWAATISAPAAAAAVQSALLQMNAAQIQLFYTVVTQYYNVAGSNLSASAYATPFAALAHQFGILGY